MTKEEHLRIRSITKQGAKATLADQQWMLDLAKRDGARMSVVAIAEAQRRGLNADGILPFEKKVKAQHG